MWSDGGSISTPSSDVVLHVYDLTSLNNLLYFLGLGAFHSGLEVHGKEYGFGAHDFSTSGVFEVEPKKCPGFVYRCSIILGQIDMHPSVFQTFLVNMASEYHGDTYQLLSKNCNHFTDDLSYRLTRKRIPGWVNRLARLGAMCSCLLPESLLVTTKQQAEYHDCSEDEVTGSLSTATPHASMDIDNDQERRLLRQVAAPEDISFVKEAKAK